MALLPRSALSGLIAGGLLLGACSSRDPARSPPLSAGAVRAAPAEPPAPSFPAPPPGARGEDPAAVYRVPLADSPARGPADALVTVVWLSDLECPSCRRAAPMVKQVERAYAGKLRLVWKHVPLSTHRNAVPAAAAAEAVRAAGGDAAFWKAAEAMLAAEPLTPEAIERVAREAGVEPRAFWAGGLVHAAHIERIRRDQNLAYPLGARTTPTFFVNGRKLVTPTPEALRALVEVELARAEGLVRAGVPRGEVYARAIEKGASSLVLLAAPAPSARGDGGSR